MLTTSDALLEQLLALKLSTVNLLEESTGLKLQVKVESQTIEKALDKQVVKRVAVLYFHSPDYPSLYCVTYINRSSLTQQEYENILKGDQPIGKLFAGLNSDAAIHKRSITVSTGQNGQIAGKLKSTAVPYYKKKYDYWIGRRKIGEVIEYFSRESLDRIKPYERD